MVQVCPKFCEFKLLLPLTLMVSFCTTVIEGHDKELFLTPMIKKGELDKAKAASLDNMKTAHVKSSLKGQVTSYSGYLTINEQFNANLFFWFFPAMEKPELAPVVLWVNELPGFSCLRGIFLDNGPFEINEKLEVGEREFAWTKTHSMLYIDTPVGSGFSFADSEEAYAKTVEDEDQEIYAALTQFFTLFSEFKDRDFYMAGQMHAATFIPHIGVRIHEESEKGAAVKINLKGFLLGSPLNDQIHQIRWSGNLYEMGLISQSQADEMSAEEDKIVALLEAGNSLDAALLAIAVCFAPDSMFVRFTGMESGRSIIKFQNSPEILRFAKFLDSKEVHNYLHVGLHKFELVNTKTFGNLLKWYSKPDTTSLVKLLDLDYKVFVYSAQFDPLIVPSGVVNMTQSLKWKGAADYGKAPRKIWRVRDDVAGYAKGAGNLHYVMVRNAGNYAIMDQPEWAFDMLRRFSSGEYF